MKKSPFPGMDPFLERPAKWRSVYTRLLNAISDQLADLVSPRFFVVIEERVILTLADDPEGQLHIEPDVYLARGAQKYEAATLTDSSRSKITQPTLIEAVYEEEIRERYLEVRDVESREVVTTIEILSPFNKSGGQRGHIDFMKKRRNVFASPVHWVEIDLIRGGIRPAEVANKSEYYALLKRSGTFGLFEVWYIGLREKLPTIAVPLLPGFDDVPLDLQTALDTVYQRAHYGDSIDYDADIPLPKLSAENEAWVREQIKAATTL